MTIREHSESKPVGEEFQARKDPLTSWLVKPSLIIFAYYCMMKSIYRRASNINQYKRIVGVHSRLFSSNCVFQAPPGSSRKPHACLNPKQDHLVALKQIAFTMRERVII